MENQNQDITHQRNLQQLPQKLIGTVELFKQKEVISSAHVSSLTIDTVKNSAQLSLVKKELGAEAAGTMILKTINEISLLTNTAMDAPVKALCAKMVVSNYWFLKIDELLMIIRDGILGRYGKIYGNFCFTTLTEWIEKYQAEKFGYVEDKNLSHTSHEKVIRDREIGINPQEQEIKPLSETLNKINDFWKDADIKP